MSGLLLIAEGTDFKILKMKQLIDNSPATTIKEFCSCAAWME
jgi:hypothetical protein